MNRKKARRTLPSEVVLDDRLFRVAEKQILAAIDATKLATD